ncbi:hypothetical protein Angca_006832 [Angiostrongylus cantonensis]|nr:hypothetical protein Angca_006832 [Angiostrongylus cantonensis]
MTSIIKNQIIKHLSKFARNLKPEQISLDVFKGKSKLHFIEINEGVLTDVLELPSWLRINRAFCTGVTVSVPWTKLKSAPVQIFIDEISVEVVLTSEPPVNRKSDRSVSTLGENTSYGFADKVVEGMSLYINTVEINFDSDAFGGSFMLSRLSVESRTPGWQIAQDLRLTRINCPDLSRVLLYKQISWQLLRIEASTKTERSEKRCTINAPLRLITSGGKIRVALKKNTLDGTVLNAQIHMLLDDILWVATIPQLRSAVIFYSYIMTLVRKSEKEFPTAVNVPTKFAETVLPNGQIPSVSNAYRTFDFEQTSYHLHIRKIDLHLCDDTTSNFTHPPDWDIESGAIQVTLYRVLIDVYPKTLATSDRMNWPRYVAPNDFTRWIDRRLAEQLSRFSVESDEAVRTRLWNCWPELLSFNVLVRIYDLVVQCVSDLNSKRDSLQNLFASDRHLKSLPNDQFILHFEFTNFMFPLSSTLPVPAPASFLQLGPFSILFDQRTIRWCLYVIHNISTAFVSGYTKNYPLSHSISFWKVRSEFQVVISLPKPSNDDRRLPLRLLISFSTLSLSNCSIGQSMSFEMLNASTADVCVVISPFLNPVYTASERLLLRTSPCWVETDYGLNTKPLPVIADVTFSGAIIIRPEQLNVYIESATEINAVLDHFQFLQLKRLAASLSDYCDVLASDQKHFNSECNSRFPTVAILLAINQIRAHILLTVGPMPSPYYSTPAFTETIVDSLSEPLRPLRSSTPKRSSSSLRLTADLRETAPTAIMDEFPVFKPVLDDASSTVDDSISVATSTEEDSNFEIEIVTEEDDLFLADLAEEASIIDETIVSDKIYKILMAKNGNIMFVDLSSLLMVANIHNKETSIQGKVVSVSLSYKLNVARSEVYENLRKRGRVSIDGQVPEPQVIFTLHQLLESSVLNIKLTVKGLLAQLDEEIVSHLGAFMLDQEMSENKICLVMNLLDSTFVIVDRNRKKPLRIKLKDCVIEQDDDYTE